MIVRKNISAEETQKHYDALPEELKDMLYSPEMTFAIQQIGQKHKLHLDQIDSLNTEVGQVMLGFTQSKDFAGNLVDLLGVDGTQATAIASDVDQMLFSKIRDAMKRVDIGSERSENTAPPQPAPHSVFASSAPAPAEPKPASTAPSALSAQKPPLSASMPHSRPTEAAPQPVPAAAQPPMPPKQPAVPAKAPDLHPAEIMMHEKTVQPAAPMKPQTPAAPPAAAAQTVPQKPQPPKPQPYKSDPYREPIE